MDLARELGRRLGVPVELVQYASAGQMPLNVVLVRDPDKKWRDEAGRKAMVTTFNVIGPRAPLSEEFRDRLRTIYY